MLKLILDTIGLSATDCLDPLAISVVVYLLSTRRPVLNSCTFGMGVVLTTFVSGLILAFGLIREVDKLLSHPQGLYFAFQLLIGVAIAFGGWRYLNHASSADPVEEPKIDFSVNPVVAFLIGTVFTATDLPTNVPLIAVADTLVRSNASVLTTILSCFAYSIVRISPPATLLLIYTIRRETSEKIIDSVQEPLTKWGHRITAGIIILLGILLVCDSVYYYCTDTALLVI